MTLADTSAWILALPPLIALMIYILEVLIGLKPLPSLPGHTAPPSIAVLIPAHNEARGIVATIERLQQEMPAGSQILVVADNCSDETASHARQAGAEVAERTDPSRRGKGFALAFGRDRLASDPPEVVVVLDADCGFGAGGLAALASAAREVPAQAVNLLAPDRAAPPLVQISSFALVVKNLLRARATSRIGGAALLTGTGMAFPWSVFADAPLATGDLVEDLSLGLTLVRAGVRPQLVEGAHVRSRPAAQTDALTQRKRWEHGFLSTALRTAPRLIVEGVRMGSRPRLAVGAHLLVPPLALLFAMTFLVLAVVAGLGLLSGNWVPALALLAALAGACGATLLAWLHVGRSWLTPVALLRAPLYILWKLPLYARFVVAPETRWLRTRRDGES
ncbi:glycosyltransferase family 2 protein [Novosphingobium sp. Gsoil 351]|uniref:glycosyltransferase family 2 protein n=1 Tax=Novosphingobium sp. Gsoil 351 TaxID=2675225 RepID=UPI0012B45A6B|nr:glycosyltransferase family 2 protein [Novosphingobium sp. Gsoil 351]QGN56088.1 glycosyltransferase [Novosphingobium sp. Gsoil 351]